MASANFLSIMAHGRHFYWNMGKFFKVRHFTLRQSCQQASRASVFPTPNRLYWKAMAIFYTRKA